MPRILRIHNRLIIGGPTHNVLNLTRYLQPDFETLLVVGEKEYHERDALHLAREKGIEPYVIPEMGRSIDLFKDYSAFRKLKSVIREYQPDIVHTHAAKPGAIGRLAAAISGVPVIVHTYHGHVFHSYFNKLKTSVFLNIERVMGRRSDALIAISGEQKRELSEKYRIAHPDKFHIIPLGFELQQFWEGREEKRKKFRHEFNLDDEDIAIGIIGRLVPVKNHRLFLEGISYLLNHSSKKVKAFIIGDGETRTELEATAKLLNIPFNDMGAGDNDGNVLTFTSWRSDIDIINAGLDVICLTSLNEGTPVSLIEAQASGNPIVSTRVGGISDIVIEGQTALLSDIGDQQNYYSNLLRIVENDEIRNQMTEKGRDFVEERFGIQRLADDFRKLYYQLLDK
jgi:glycosyltransferase involved in cell wall biosynthesis